MHGLLWEDLGQGNSCIVKAWPQNSGAREALMSSRRREHPGEGREEGRRKETSPPWVRKGKQCQDYDSGFSLGG